jgi:hypothetical protein
MSPVRRVRGVPLEDLVIWVAAVCVTVFVVWSAFRVRDMAAQMYANSDISSAPVLAQLLPDKGSGYIVLGFYPWLESLFALDLTRWVPGHVAFWKAAPFLVYGITILLVGWTVWRTVSLRTGLLVTLAMAAPAPLVIYMLGAPDQRLPAFAHAVLMAAFIVTVPWLARWGYLGRGLWAATLALTLAPGVASDPLIILGAALPFLVAIAFGWRAGLLPRQVVMVAFGACLAGTVGGWGLEHLAEHYRYVYSHPDWNLGTVSSSVSNAWLLLKVTALFAHGQFVTDPPPVDRLDVVRIGVAIVAIGVVLLLVVGLARASRRFLADASRPSAPRLLAVYWGASILLVCAPYVFTTTPVALNSVRYVTTIWPALLTLVALVYARRAHVGLAVLATVCAVIGCFELKRDFYDPPVVVQPTPAEVAQLERIAASHDLDHGYANYWDAMPITLESDFDVRAYPIVPCGPPGNYCPFQLHVIESWYAPKPGARSFYVVGDQALTPHLGSPPAAWDPVKRIPVGHLTVYVFDYDIATRLLPFVPAGLAAPERKDQS